MNITSCDNCGVVLDKDKLKFPDDLYNEKDEIDDNKVVWLNKRPIACTPCPVCKNKIME